MPFNADLTLFYSPGSCSLASHILLEETGGTFKAVRVLLSADEHKTPAFLAINPKGRVPALSDGGWILTETPAILRYICERCPDADLWPQDVRASARCAKWLAWTQSSLDVAVSQVSRTSRYVDHGDGAPVVASGKRKIVDLAAQTDRKLQDRDWAVGEAFTPVDAPVPPGLRMPRGWSPVRLCNVSLSGRRCSCREQCRSNHGAYQSAGKRTGRCRRICSEHLKTWL